MRIASKALLVGAAILVALALAAPVASADPVEVEDAVTGVHCDNTAAGECEFHAVDSDGGLMQVHTFFGEINYVCASELTADFHSDGTGTLYDVTFSNVVGGTGNCGNLSSCEEPWPFETFHDGAGNEFMDAIVCVSDGLGQCEGEFLMDLIIPDALLLQTRTIEGTNCETDLFWEWEGAQPIEVHHL